MGSKVEGRRRAQQQPGEQQICLTLFIFRSTLPRSENRCSVRRSSSLCERSGTQNHLTDISVPTTSGREEFGRWEIGNGEREHIGSEDTPKAEQLRRRKEEGQKMDKEGEREMAMGERGRERSRSVAGSLDLVEGRK